mmetsp:Transcript_20469/g.42898  ORF Transcript_20469/g.42898 Transcript_20469/m.42898 type:complete len:207 (+) Transcript_20469:133-753(+)|eukprot:CAMPEP_0118648416 /NCGR_PEP_ID=MMETSP0785-20121206/9144_1 /TAXON_ID=91992 /ORGANISM="Bolidomonas pacifica, Strain CCMP 1866" /LENGTH=206 /DNA_ID=CAMNT_0006540607 /DNA_START=106 /DNA_END=726 /DNA_ORIENTATION=+
MVSEASPHFQESSSIHNLPQPAINTTSPLIKSIVVPLLSIFVPFSLNEKAQSPLPPNAPGDEVTDQTDGGKDINDDDNSSVESDCSSSFSSSPQTSDPYPREHRIIPSCLPKSASKIPSTTSTSLSSGLSSFYQSSQSVDDLVSSTDPTSAIPIRGAVCDGLGGGPNDAGEDYGFFADFVDPIGDEVLIRNTPPKTIYSIGEDLEE